MIPSGIKPYSEPSAAAASNITATGSGKDKGKDEVAVPAKDALKQQLARQQAMGKGTAQILRGKLERPPQVAHGVYTLGGVSTATLKERLSKSEAGRHFKERFEALETSFRHREPGERELADKCNALLECAEAFAGELGTKKSDIPEHVQRDYGLHDKDPAEFQLSVDEYEAVCQAVGRLKNDPRPLETAVNHAVANVFM